MSFALELPRIPAGTPEQQLAEISRYLHETAAQLNYALGFLNLPSASAANVASAATETGVIEISEKSTNAQQPSAAAVYKFVTEHAVPAERTVNGKPLTSDVTLTAEDVGAASQESVAEAIAESEERYADYVAETGVTDGWAWRKWAGGEIILWKTGAAAQIDGAWSVPSAGITTALCSIQLPFALHDAAYYAGIGLAEPAWVAEIAKQADEVAFLAVSTAEQQSIHADVLIRGKWK
jgi:hypothetical protein